ncbi:hypothetical protein STEG23_023056 [Scotinomys teguina]
MNRCGAVSASTKSLPDLILLMGSQLGGGFASSRLRRPFLPSPGRPCFSSARGTFERTFQAAYFIKLAEFCPARYDLSTEDTIKISKFHAQFRPAVVQINAHAKPLRKAILRDSNSE